MHFNCNCSSVKIMRRIKEVTGLIIEEDCYREDYRGLLNKICMMICLMMHSSHYYETTLTEKI